VTDRAQLTAVILAGGLGTRLRSVVADRPKVLAEVAGRPFLGYLLDQLAGWGLSQVVLCTGYLGEQIEEEFAGGYGGLRIQYSREVTPLGTGGALRLALPLIRSPTVLVLNGDSYCTCDFSAFRSSHVARKAAATLLLVQSADTERFGKVEVGTDGAILHFAEKQVGGGAGLINAGVYLVELELLRSIPCSGPVSLERDIFPAWLQHRLYGYRTSGLLLDIGTPESYAQAEAFFAGCSGT
jgi:NDP-sugar pyrophosphorylase family protein